MRKVYLFVEIYIKAWGKAEFLGKLLNHGAHIRIEEGCEALEIFQDTKNQDRICVWEIWTDRDLWDSHMVNDASKAWQIVAKEFVHGEKITVMNSL